MIEESPLALETIHTAAENHNQDLKQMEIDFVVVVVDVVVAAWRQSIGPVAVDQT